MVSGLVAAVWRTRLMIANADQYRFHTVRGAKVLNELSRSAKRVEIVT